VKETACNIAERIGFGEIAAAHADVEEGRR